jgi:hypothetical protein
MYQIIERMVPGGRKIEVFARNHNLRKGWLSLGNELGEYYDWGRDKISCDVCAKVIEIGKVGGISPLLSFCSYPHPIKAKIQGQTTGKQRSL